METIEIRAGNQDLTFRVQFEHDDIHGAPWEECDGHGVVSDWEHRDKRPGELILNTDRGAKRFYDFAETCKKALAEGWDAHPYNTDGKETKRQQAAKAARADYEYLRAWCNDEWHYVIIIVTLLDDEGNETEVSDSLGGVETLNDHHHEQARLIADELARGYGVSWDRISKETYGYTQQKAG